MRSILAVAVVVLCAGGGAVGAQESCGGHPASWCYDPYVRGMRAHGTHYGIGGTIYTMHDSRPKSSYSPYYTMYGSSTANGSHVGPGNGGHIGNPSGHGISGGVSGAVAIGR